MRLIIDSDLDTDCDDAGALAIMHHYLRQDRIDVLGVVCSTPYAASARCAAQINAWYGRSDIPVAMVDANCWRTNPAAERYERHRKSLGAAGRLYSEQLSSGYERSDFPEACTFYRQALEAQPEGSVTICAIGTCTALAALLASPADDVSPLTGQELVARKVRLLVSMAGGNYPSGRDGFNWRMDPYAASAVIAHWPGPMAVQPLGKDVPSGASFMAAAARDCPVREAYRLWLGAEDRNRASFDQLTLIYAVEGTASLLTERRGLTLRFDAESGEHEWQVGAGGPERIALDAAVDANELSKAVEHRMIASLSR